MNPGGPWFVCRPRIVRYCCLSWEGSANASRNTVLRNGNKRRSHPRVLVLTEARRRLLTSRTNMRLKGNKFQRPQARHGTNPRSSSPGNGLAPQKSAYSFHPPAPAAARRPRRIPSSCSERTRPNTITSAGVPQLLFFLHPEALPAANAVTTRAGGVRGSARPRASRPFRMRSAAFQM